MIRTTLSIVALLVLVSAALARAYASPVSVVPQDKVQDSTTPPADSTAVVVQYLEFVTPDVSATCAALAAMHGVEFSEPDATLGNARTAALVGGGMLGVRAPLRETEEPVVRAYRLVHDINSALKHAETTGAQVAMTATPLPGHGTFAIYVQGGIEHGLWAK